MGRDFVKSAFLGSRAEEPISLVLASLHIHAKQTYKMNPTTMQSWGQLTLISMEKVSQNLAHSSIQDMLRVSFEFPNTPSQYEEDRLANCNHTTNINNLSLLAASPYPHYIHVELNEEIICPPSEKKAR